MCKRSRLSVHVVNAAAAYMPTMSCTCRLLEESKEGEKHLDSYAMRQDKKRQGAQVAPIAEKLNVNPS